MTQRSDRREKLVRATQTINERRWERPQRLVRLCTVVPVHTLPQVKLRRHHFEAREKAGKPARLTPKELHDKVRGRRKPKVVLSPRGPKGKEREAMKRHKQAWKWLTRTNRNLAKRRWEANAASSERAQSDVDDGFDDGFEEPGYEGMKTLNDEIGSGLTARQESLLGEMNYSAQGGISGGGLTQEQLAFLAKESEKRKSELDKRWLLEGMGPKVRYEGVTRIASTASGALESAAPTYLKGAALERWKRVEAEKAEARQRKHDAVPRSVKVPIREKTPPRQWETHQYGSGWSKRLCGPGGYSCPEHA